MVIRPARVADADEIWKVHTASIRHFCTKAYSAEVIQEWTSVLEPDRYVETIETLEFVVAEVDARVEGFCILNLETGELHAIYLSPAQARKGLGRELMAWAEDSARKRGWTELFLKATLNAVPFYEKCGYHRGQTTSHPLPSGTPRACVEMRKRLVS